MVDQVKSLPMIRLRLNSRYGAISQTDIFSLLPLAVPLVQGLFMGSGKTISLAGPSIIFVYMIIGFMLFFVMRAMGNCCFRIWNTNL